MLRSFALLAGVLCLVTPRLAADDAPSKASRMTAQELGAWIDARFAEEYKQGGVKPADTVDDATYLRRISLDLQGRIPTVAQVRDFLADASSYKRRDYVERLLTEQKLPERFGRRSADHLARVWRRMMIPASAPNAALGPQLDPWLAGQFAANTPYDEMARKLLLVAPRGPRGLRAVPAPASKEPADPDAAAAVFQQAIGGAPENLAAGYVRVFLGVRLNCAQCHNHPLADWKRNDFWGIAALFSGGARQDKATPAPTITPNTEKQTFTAKLLWMADPLKEIPANKSSREFLADWMVSAENPNFAATAVNRTWQYLCGRGLAGSVDDLDRVSPQERQILDELSKLFVDSKYDLRWLIAGICQSKVYQQGVVKRSGSDQETFLHRPLKTLLPEQVFDSLEQALALPVAKVDNGPRFNGEREQFIARLNEAATDTPADFKGGIPQALMLMNGRMTADATSLESSRTLRAVVEAPFLENEERLEVLYLAAFSRKPRKEEAEILLKHVLSKPDGQARHQAFAEVFWGLLNSPEFVLSR